MDFALEQLETCQREIEALVEPYLEEVGTLFEDKVNWDVYHELSAQGVFHVVTARHESALVGFIAFYVVPHPNSNGRLVGMEAGMYLQPEHRKGMAGVTLINTAERYARAEGAIGMVVTTRPGKELGPLLKLRNYTPFEQSYFKRFG